MRTVLIFLWAFSAAVAGDRRDLFDCKGQLSVVPAIAKSQVDRLLSEASIPTTAIDPFGGCENTSQELRRILRERGLDARRVRVKNRLPIRVGRRREDVEAFHYFVTVPLERGGELVVDGSYLQFVHEGLLRAEDYVFVGTRDDLVDYFTDEQDNLQLSAFGNGRGRVDPEEFVDKYYGYGDAAGSRTLK